MTRTPGELRHLNGSFFFFHIVSLARGIDSVISLERDIGKVKERRKHPWMNHISNGCLATGERTTKMISAFQVGI